MLHHLCLQNFDASENPTNLGPLGALPAVVALYILRLPRDEFIKTRLNKHYCRPCPMDIFSLKILASMCRQLLYIRTLEKQPQYDQFV
jgi:hypothetical protein